MITIYRCTHCNKDFEIKDACEKHELTHCKKLDAVHVGAKDARPCRCNVTEIGDSYQLAFVTTGEEGTPTRTFTYRLSKNQVQMNFKDVEAETTE